MFVRSTQELEILTVYVHDLILITKAVESMNKPKAAFKEHYKMKDMGNIYNLGISMIQDKEKKLSFFNRSITVFYYRCFFCF